MSDEMTRLDEIAARREDPGNRELIDGGCEGTGEYSACHDASVLIEAMDADLAALLAVVREVARLHPREAATCLNPTHADYEQTIGQVCGTCGDAWPCRTIAAIDAAPTTTEEKNR